MRKEGRDGVTFFRAGLGKKEKMMIYLELDLGEEEEEDISTST